MNHTAEILVVLLILWFVAVIYITYLFGRLTYSTRNYELVIYKFHRYIVTYIFALPLLIITLALLKAIGELL